MKYTQVYTDENGESHFQDVEIEFKSIDFAPPAPPLDISNAFPAIECSFLKAPAKWFGDWHPAPFRQLHFYLAGEVEAETSDGEIRRFKQGDVVLVEDTIGKGHRSRNIGLGEGLIGIIKLDDSDL
ncbi:MAG: cupin domain-containing protein [Candidatus Zixiibacteriota bacterium]|nr:MAG: cupin domain-containing protein [candidate division Zixibacteria bacterium]